MNSNLPIATQISSLDRKITALSEILKPRADDTLPRCIKSLLSAGLVFPASIDPSMAVEVYRFALSGLPAVALKLVTEKLIRGECDRVDAGFLPKPPEMAVLVRAEAQRLRDDLARMRDTRATLGDLSAARSRPIHDDASKARVRALVAATMQRLAPDAKGDGHER